MIEQPFPAPPPAATRSARPALYYWIIDHDLTLTSFAERYGFLKQEVSMWCRPWDDSSRRTPFRDKATRLLELTNGEIGLDSFVHPDLRGRPAAAEPAFTPSAEARP